MDDIVKAKAAIDKALADLIELLNHPADGRVLDHQVLEGSRSTIRRVYRNDGTDNYDLHVEHFVKVIANEAVTKMTFRVPLEYVLKDSASTRVTVGTTLKMEEK